MGTHISLRRNHLRTGSTAQLVLQLTALTDPRLSSCLPLPPSTSSPWSRSVCPAALAREIVDSPPRSPCTAQPVALSLNSVLPTSRDRPDHSSSSVTNSETSSWPFKSIFARLESALPAQSSRVLARHLLHVASREERKKTEARNAQK